MMNLRRRVVGELLNRGPVIGLGSLAKGGNLFGYVIQLGVTLTGNNNGIAELF